jgi:class 3 adenylate cyclase
VASKCSPLQSSAGSVARRSPGEFSFPSPNLTALFADLKGSTVLIEGLDPEEAQVLIDPAVQLMMEAVHRYEGYVAQALGEGIFALFSAPIAHEDHPQRALYTALLMQKESLYLTLSCRYRCSLDY